MNRSQRKTLITILAAIVVGLAIVATSYVIGKGREEKHLAQDEPTELEAQSKKDQDEKPTEDFDVKAFEASRQAATVLDYLNYVKAMGEKPKVMGIQTTAIQRELLTGAMAQLAKELPLEMTETIDYSESAWADWSENLPEVVAEKKPHVLMVPVNAWPWYSEGKTLENTAREYQLLYARIREANPDTLILFTVMPVLSTDETALDYVSRLDEALADASLVTLGLEDDFQAQVETEGLEAFYQAEENVLTEKGQTTLKNILVKALQEDKIDTRRGYQGETDDLADLKATAESVEAAKEEEAAAAAEAQRQAKIEASKAAEEKRQKEAEEARRREEAAQQQNPPSQNQPQQPAPQPVPQPQNPPVNQGGNNGVGQGAPQAGNQQ